MCCRLTCAWCLRSLLIVRENAIRFLGFLFFSFFGGGERSGKWKLDNPFNVFSVCSSECIVLFVANPPEAKYRDSGDWIWRALLSGAPPGSCEEVRLYQQLKPLIKVVGIDGGDGGNSMRL